MAPFDSSPFHGALPGIALILRIERVVGRKPKGLCGLRVADAPIESLRFSIRSRSLIGN
jgi:hypothetical protein